MDGFKILPFAFVLFLSFFYPFPILLHASFSYPLSVFSFGDALSKCLVPKSSSYPSLAEAAQLLDEEVAVGHVLLQGPTGKVLKGSGCQFLK